jgi:GH24 family phage-related lysozyme (muramidase)
MNIEKLRRDLEYDEGVINSIYKDHLGYPTFGIGHLITKNDREYGQEVGTLVPEWRSRAVFETDIEIVLKDCVKLYDDFYDLPEEAQLVIANMMFNLGYTRFSKFKGMKSGVDSRDWNKAADEMIDSRWYRQVTNRANRLVERIKALV